ncbi:adenine phosphoribosyltransferase [Dubosiella muris]|uniref:Adenine phosphoribosyltransferase n=1 Tax=Dubosiella muris TaxID=3038133 RepID=A0AC61R759_9FIRM|nr:adenine phosphoribosyltransferase [Dubosiella muris]TGY65852.1 adenine phosphoribosyltransferase [Dubosiella muris]
MNIKNYIESIPDFPKKGIMFRDITPILAHPEAMRYVTGQIVEFAKKVDANLIVAPEARGFFFGTPAAIEANIGFAPVRKPGKLPRETMSVTYELEYGEDELQMHVDAIHEGDRVLIVDDLLATGGTVDAIVRLVESRKAKVVGIAFVIELDDLKGREKFKDIPVLALTHYEGE